MSTRGPALAPAGLALLPATPDDAEAISALILRLAHHFTLDPQGRGAEPFLQEMAPGGIGRLLQAPDIRYLKAQAGTALAGVIALKGGRHIYHLFVAPAFQGRGLSRRLWEHARALALADGAGPRAFSVNASPNAVPVYARFGFVPAGARTEMRGIAFVPMRRAPEPGDAGADAGPP